MEFDGKSIISYMSQRLDKDVRIEDLCRHTNLNRIQLTSHFNRQFGMTPIKFFWYFKTIVTFKLSLKFIDEKVYRIADFMNFRNREHFSKKTQEVLGLKPKELRSSSGIQKLNHEMNPFAFAEECILTLIEEIEPMIERAIENIQLRYQQTKRHQAITAI